MRVLKYALLAVGALVLVAGAVLAYIAATFDPNQYKPRIVHAVKERTQRTLRLEGDIGLSFWPSIGAKIGKASLSERGSEREFAAVDEVRVALKLLPLLSREAVVETVRVRGLRVNLVKAKDGRLNVDDLTSPRAAKEAPAPKGGGPGFGVAVAGLDIENATLAYTDQAAETRVTLSKLKLKTGRIAPGVPGRVELSFNVKGDEPKLDLHAELKSRLAFDSGKQSVALDDLALEAKGAAADFRDLAFKAEGGATVDGAKERAQVQLAGSVGGGATGGRWSGGGGTFSPSASALNARYTPSASEIASGGVTLTLTSDDPSGPCAAVSDPMRITIDPAAIANAGPDQTVCASAPRVDLQGAVGGGASTGTWSGGAGTFSPRATALNASYTPTAAEIAAGRVTLSLTTNDPAGPCPAVSDPVTITIDPVTVVIHIAEVGNAVDLLCEIDPHRHRRCVEAGIARRHAEVEDLLARGANGNLGKELAEPRTAGEDVDICFDDRRDGGRLDVRRAIDAARFHEGIAHDRTRVARRQSARSPLEPHGANSVEADLWISLRGGFDTELFDGESELAQNRNRCAHVRIVAAMKPQRARFDVERRIERFPQLVRASHHLDVDPIRPVDRANHARFAAGARARVARSPRIDEGDLCAESAKVERDPAAERARADDGDSRSSRAGKDCGERKRDGPAEEGSAVHGVGERPLTLALSPPRWGEGTGGLRNQNVTRVLTPIVRGWFVRYDTRARLPRSMSSARNARSSVMLLMNSAVSH